MFVQRKSIRACAELCLQSPLEYWLAAMETTRRKVANCSRLVPPRLETHDHHSSSVSMEDDYLQSKDFSNMVRQFAYCLMGRPISRFNSIHLICIGAVVEWIANWILDLQVTGSNPGAAT